MGSFGTALGGFNTPETQQADCDLALGLMVQAVANSRYAADTLFIITEDDVQDGPDHVDSHRGTAYVVGPYVKKGSVVSTRYSQVNALRTIEDILGTEHLNPEHRLPAADDGRLRHAFVGQMDVYGGGFDCLVDHDAGAGGEAWGPVRGRAGHHTQARRRLLGRSHGGLQLR
jgi:hypothetical protein